jgi:hypothetical protein
MTKPKKPPTSRKLVTKPIGAVDKRRRKRGLTVAVRTAIDALIYERCTRVEACERAGLTERALYLALEKPEVAAYFNNALDVLRAGERPKNIHRLCEIRDAADNMPAVNAIKALEQIDAEAIGRPNTAAQTPGVVVRIINVTQPSTDAGKVIHVTPTPKPATAIESSDPIFKRPGH